MTFGQESHDMFGKAADARLDIFQKALLLGSLLVVVEKEVSRDWTPEGTRKPSIVAAVGPGEGVAWC